MLTSLASAFPPSVPQRDLWEMASIPEESRLARVAWLRSGVERRGVALRPDRDDVSEWSTGSRMERFVEEALPLAERAALGALERSGMEAEAVDRLVVATCTGYATPGIDVLLADRLGMAPSLDRLHIGHMGCHAAVPALTAAADAAAARSLTSLVVCVEVTSLHLQPDPASASQVVPHALFADGAAAAVVVPLSPDRPQPGLEIVDVVSLSDTREAELMRWDVTDHGFRMGLSAAVPRVLSEHVEDVTKHLLSRNGLHFDDVGAWAVHPGGPRILDVVGDRLGLSEEDLGPSRQVLAEHGNCSSATLLAILEGLTPPAGGHVVGMAFGPGLTLAAVLLRHRGAQPSAV